MTSVRHTNGDYLTTTTFPAMTGSWTIGGWLKNNAHSSGSEVTMFGLCNSGGDSEGIVLSTGLTAAGNLTALAFVDGGGTVVQRNVYTGSYTGWIAWLIRHKSGSTTYEVSWRYEDSTAWQTVYLALPAQISAPSGEMRLGSSIFNLHATDCTSRHFFCQETYMTDVQALTASRAIGTAPAGTNLHYLALASAATATTNGGTAGAWTPTGTLTDHATDPTEGTLPATRLIGMGPMPAGAFGSTTCAASFPVDVGFVAGDKLWLVVGTKPDTATINTPSGGWAPLASDSGGGGTTGADAGPTKLAVFELDATGSETGTVSVSITGGNSSFAYIVVGHTDEVGGWSIATTSGTDSTTGAAWSVTGGANPGIEPGDLLFCPSVVPTDVNFPDKMSGYGLAATGVSAWSAIQELVEVGSTTGNDIGCFACYGYAVTGTASAAPTLTATAASTTTNVRGVTAFIRARGLAGGTDLTPPLLSAASSLLAPALALALAAPLLAASPTLFAPTILSGSDVAPPLLVASPTLLEPTLSVSLQAPLLTASTQLFDPYLQQAGPPQAMPPPAPVVPGELNRRLPPFWPPSEVPRSTVLPITVNPPVLVAAPQLFDPQVVVALAVPALSASPSLPAPSVSVQLQAALLSASPALLTPQIDPGLQAPLITATPSLPAPAVSVQVAAPVLVAAPSVFAPRIDVALSGALLSAASTPLAPSVAVQIQAPLLAASPELLAPTVAWGLTAPLLSATSALTAPSVDIGLQAPLLAASPALFAPTIQVDSAQNLTPPLLTAATALPAPSLAVALTPPVLAASSILLPPAVSQVGTVAPPVLVASSMLLPPTVSVAMTAPVLSASPTLPSPTVSVGVQAPLLAAASTLHAPRVDIGVLPPALSAASSLLTPGVTVQLALPLLSATSSLLLPTVSQDVVGAIQPPLLVATSQLLAPTLAINLQAVLLVASSQLLVPTVTGPVPAAVREPIQLRSSYRNPIKVR